MATNNASKLREARAIAGDSLEILSLKDIGSEASSGVIVAVS